MCQRKIKGNKIFLLSWASLEEPEEEFLVHPLDTYFVININMNLITN
jgi:hypothetical protein